MRLPATPCQPVASAACVHTRQTPHHPCPRAPCQPAHSMPPGPHTYEILKHACGRVPSATSDACHLPLQTRAMRLPATPCQPVHSAACVHTRQTPHHPCARAPCQPAHSMPPGPHTYEILKHACGRVPSATSDARHAASCHSMPAGGLGCVCAHPSDHTPSMCTRAMPAGPLDATRSTHL